MRERIVGTECEYGLFHQLPAGSSEAGAKRGGLSGKALRDHLKRLSDWMVEGLHDGSRAVAGEFLDNGGRFYIDRGGHPEYATPECRSIRDLVAHEVAGDRIVQDLATKATAFMARDGLDGKLHIFKNNLDPRGRSFGSHENYLVAPFVMDAIQKFIPFLVTRQIFAGSGKIIGTAIEGRCPFSLSQRADFIDHVFSDRTSETRGIINTRKREIKHREENIRLHVILGDSNLSEHAIGLKIGTTAIVLGMLEEEGLESLPLLSNPVAALKSIAVSRDSPLALEGGSRSLTALEIQEMYLERAHAFLGSRTATEEERSILERWEVTLFGLKQLKTSETTGAILEDPAELRGKLDWVLKLWLLNRAREKRGLPWNDPHLRHLDYKYHDLDPETGLYERCRALELVDPLVSLEEVLRARREPPPGTRAWMRGAVIRTAAGRNVEIFIKDWESIKLVAKGKSPHSNHPFDRNQRLLNSLKVDLKDPFMGPDPTMLERVSHFLTAWDGR